MYLIYAYQSWRRNGHRRSESPGGAGDSQVREVGPHLIKKMKFLY